MTESEALYFGPLAAQADPDILNYFYVTDQIKRLIHRSAVGPAQFIVASRPGAGKSALFEWVASPQSNLEAIVIRGANKRIIPPDPSMNVDDYRTLAFGEFATAFIVWAKNLVTLRDDTKRRISSLRRKKTFAAIKVFLGEDFEGLNVLGCGFNLAERQRKDYLKELRSADYQHELEEVIKKIASESRPVFILDDPEFTIAEGLDELSPPNAQRLGGLLSALGKLDALGIRTLVFIRENVYRAVVDHYHDASHFADRVQGLGWTENDLIGLLQLRLEWKAQISWGNAFKVNEARMARLVFPFLVNGPRDLIRICNTAGSAGAPISTASLDRAIEQASRDRWAETRKQFSSLFPLFDKFAGAILREAAHEFGSDKIEPHALDTLIQNALTTPGSELHKLRSQDWIDALPFEPHRAVDLLYAAGCLGYYQGKNRIFPWAGRSTEKLALADGYFLSPAFTKTLT